VKILEASTAYR